MMRRGHFLRFASACVIVLMVLHIYSSSSLLALNPTSQRCITENIPQEVTSLLLENECVIGVIEKTYGANSKDQNKEITVIYYNLSSGKTLIYSKDLDSVVLGRKWASLPNSDDLALNMISLLAYDKFKPLENVSLTKYSTSWSKWNKFVNKGLDVAKRVIVEISIINLVAGIALLIIAPPVGTLSLALMIITFTANLLYDLCKFIENFYVNEKNSPRLFYVLALMPTNEEGFKYFHNTLDRLSKDNFISDKKFISEIKNLSRDVRDLTASTRHAITISRFALLFAFIHLGRDGAMLSSIEKLIGAERLEKLGAFFIFDRNVEEFRRFKEAVWKAWVLGKFDDLNGIIQNTVTQTLRNIGASLIIQLIKDYVIKLGEDTREFLGFHTSHSLLARDLSYNLLIYLYNLKYDIHPPTLDNVLSFYYYDFLLQTLTQEYYEGVLNLTENTLYNMYREILEVWGFDRPPTTSEIERKNWVNRIKERFRSHVEQVKNETANTLKSIFDYAYEVFKLYKEFSEDMAKRRAKHGGPTPRGIDFYLVIDTSGSMRDKFQGETKLDAAKRAARDFIHVLSPQDRVGIVRFSSTAELLLDLTNETRRAEQIIDKLVPMGTTAMGDGLWLAIDRLQSIGRPDTLKVILLLTDGVHNAGKHTPVEAAERARQLNIPIYAIGYGEKGDIDEATLRDIASITNGEYYYAPSSDKLRELYVSLSKFPLGYDIKETSMGTLRAGEVKALELEVKDSIKYFSAILSYTGSKLSLEIIDPEGREIPTDSGNTIYSEVGNHISFTVYNPGEGVWKILVRGIETPPEGTTYRLLILEPPVAFDRNSITMEGYSGGKISETLYLTTKRKLVDMRIKLMGDISDILTVTPGNLTNIPENHKIEVKLEGAIPPNVEKANYFGLLIIESMGLIIDLPVTVYVNNTLIPHIGVSRYDLREGTPLELQIFLQDLGGREVNGANIVGMIRNTMFKFNETMPAIYLARIDTSNLPIGSNTIDIKVEKTGYNRVERSITIRIIMVGDINLDNIVDYRDLAILGRSYGTKSMETDFNARADLNDDGTIDFRDLALLGMNYGRSG